MKRLRLAAFATALVSTLALFQNCSGAKSSGGTVSGTNSSSSSGGTRFQTANSNGVSCNLQSFAVGSPVVVALGGPISTWSITQVSSPDLAACNQYCEDHGAVLCSLTRDPASAVLYCSAASAASAPQLGAAPSTAGNYAPYIASGACSNSAGGASPSGNVLLDPKVFVASDYLARYGDLRATFGSDTNAASQHWLNFGLAEGRQGNSSFLASAYLARYADLRAAFGNDYKKAAEHFVQYGAAEGRLGAPAVAPPPPPVSACGGTRGAGAVVQQSVTSGNPGFAGVQCGKMSGSVNQCFSCSARWQYASGAFTGAVDQVINCTCD